MLAHLAQHHDGEFWLVGIGPFLLLHLPIILIAVGA
jgi:hypothetical protein